MKAGYRSTGRASSKAPAARVCVWLPVAVVLVAVPCIAVFYWSASESPEPSVSAVTVEPAPQRRENPADYAGLAAASLPMVSNPRYISPGSQSPDLLSLTRRGLASAPDDPFAAAVASGNTEGELVVRRVERGIPVLGPPAPRWASAAPGQREAMKSISLGVGGSFRKFFADLFESDLPPASETDSELAELLNSHEENPFARAREVLAQPAEAAPAADAPVAEPDPVPADPATAAAPSPAAKPAPVANTAAALPVVTVRPNILLRVDEAGVLHPVAASRPASGRLESAEYGVRDFALLPFEDAAEFPMAMGVADFNGDRIPDVVIHIALQGKLRFFYGSPDGSYTEGLRIDAGIGLRSIAAGDFNGDARMDLVVSQVGTGSLVTLFGEDGGTYRYKASYSDIYRDFITAADVGSGRLSVLGMSFGNHGSVLIDYSRDGGYESGARVDYEPPFATDVTSAKGARSRLSTALMGGALSVNLENRMGLPINVLNVAARTDIYVVVGDIDTTGSITVALGRLRN